MAAGVALLLFPTADFLIVLLARFAHDPTISLIVLPAVFTGVAILLCRLLAVGLGPTVTTTGGCLLACVFVSLIALMLAAFMSFFNSF